MKFIPATKEETEQALICKAGLKGVITKELIHNCLQKKDIAVYKLDAKDENARFVIFNLITPITRRDFFPCVRYPQEPYPKHPTLIISLISAVEGDSLHSHVKTELTGRLYSYIKTETSLDFTLSSPIEKMPFQDLLPKGKIPEKIPIAQPQLCYPPATSEIYEGGYFGEFGR